MFSHVSLGVCGVVVLPVSDGRHGQPAPHQPVHGHSSVMGPPKWSRTQDKMGDQKYLIYEFELHLLEARSAMMLAARNPP